MAISSNGASFLTISSDDKNLILWDLTAMTKVSETTTSDQLCAIAFTDNSSSSFVGLSKVASTMVLFETIDHNNDNDNNNTNNSDEESPATPPDITSVINFPARSPSMPQPTMPPPPTPDY